MEGKKIIITRNEAKAKGFKRFYTGKPCVRNHDSERYTSNGICVVCSNTKRRKKGKTNPLETELDYAQIGKAIMDRMQQLEKHLERSLLNNRDVEQMKQDNIKLTNKIKEQHDQIQKLNQTISRLNEAKSRIPTNKTFKLSEVANIR